MYFYKRVLFTVLGFAMITIIIFLTGMSNYESSVGAPSLLEIQLHKQIKYSNLKRNLISSLSFENFENIVIVDTNLSLNLTRPSGKKVSYSYNGNENYVIPKENTQFQSQRSRTRTLKEEMNSRVNRVTDLCKKYHIGSYSWFNGTNDLGIKDPPTPLYSYFFVNKENKIAWCPVYKAGSTSWLHNMMILKGYSEEDLRHPPKQLSVLAREVYPDPESGQDFNEATKILIVRHPFERLVSAFRDKLSNSTIGLEHGTAHFYEKYGKKIVEKFRQDRSIRQLEPTFEEFVRYLLKIDLVYYADDHWLPAYLSCTPCRVSYDYILKVETYTEDQKFVISELNLTHVIKPKWKHSNPIDSNRNRNHQLHQSQSLPVSATAKTYFSQLSQSQVYLLYKKYFLDFEFFDYSYKEYINFVRKD